jgi:dolichol-phosphate mannosyltransferase
MQARDSPLSLEIVIPVYNEETVLHLLLARLRAVFAPEELARHRIASVRYLIVDDGSADRTAAILADEVGRGLPARVCCLSRNFGHQNAVSAGLDLADADVVAVMDADLQDPPEAILAMLERWREGYDVVYAERRRRKESAVKRAGYWAFYRLVAALADLDIPKDSGDFCLLDRRVVRALRNLPEKLRFPRGLRAWIGFRQIGFPINRPSREAGRSKYTLSALYRLATDGIVSSSIRPLQVAQVFSVSYLILTLIGLFLLLGPRGPVVSREVLAGYLLILSGNFVQVFCIYILGAYVGRTYLEVKGRPTYVVREIIECSGRNDA